MVMFSGFLLDEAVVRVPYFDRPRCQVFPQEEAIADGFLMFLSLHWCLHRPSL